MINYLTSIHAGLLPSHRRNDRLRNTVFVLTLARWDITAYLNTGRLSFKGTVSLRFKRLEVFTTNKHLHTLPPALVKGVLIRDIRTVNACFEKGWTPRSTWHMAEKKKKWYRGHDISAFKTFFLHKRKERRVILWEHEKAAWFHKYTMMLKVRRICSFPGTKKASGENSASRKSPSPSQETAPGAKKCRSLRKLPCSAALQMPASNVPPV